MGASLTKFCMGKTDANKNGKADIDEVFDLINVMQARLEEVRYRAEQRRPLPVLTPNVPRLDHTKDKES